MTTLGSGQDGDQNNRFTLDRNLAALKRRLVGEAGLAISMLEAALDALWRQDADAAREVRRRDDAVDREEVEIEAECFRLLALQHTFAHDFRVITFILKVNADVERVADHAAGIAKVAARLRRKNMPFPQSLKELGQRVPMMCHSLMRAVLDEDAELARRIVAEDEVIDTLEKRLFEETEEMMRREPDDAHDGLLIYRVGRELERVGDLMKSIAEDIVYLVTGSIVRHEGKLAQARPA